MSRNAIDAGNFEKGLKQVNESVDHANRMYGAKDVVTKHAVWMANGLNHLRNASEKQLQKFCQSHATASSLSEKINKYRKHLYPDQEDTVAII